MESEKPRIPAAPQSAMEALAEQVMAGTMGTFLVQGEPGTGKSIFARELLNIKGRGTYITTTVRRGNKREATPTGRSIVFEDVDPALASLLDSGSEGIGPRKRAERVQELVMESITERPKGVIVIDSWDTIAREMRREDRLEVEQRLVATVEATDSMLIIINDQSESSLESLVDGVVELRRMVHQEAILRVLEVKKLSQFTSPQPMVVFTLVGGRFRLFGPPTIPSPAKYTEVFRAIPHPEGRYSTGMPEVDRLVGGGYPRGATVTLELGNGVALDSVLPMTLARMANFVRNGGCVVGLPTSGTPPGWILDPLRAMLPPGSVDLSVRLGYYREYDDDCTFLVNADSAGQTFEMLWQQIEEMKGSEHRPCNVSLGVEKLEHIHGGENVLKNLVVTLSRIKSYKDFCVLTLYSDSPNIKAISEMTDFHLTFETHFNVLTLQPQKPKGPLNVVDYDYSSGHPEVTLTPIF